MALLVILIITILVLVLCLIMKDTYIQREKAAIKLEGRLTDYRAIKNDFYYYATGTLKENLQTDFHMTDETIEDFQKNLRDYKCYRIDFRIHNPSNYDVFGLRPKLINSNRNVWLDVTSLHECGALNISKGEESQQNLLIIVKTGGMSEREIDALIRSIKFGISYYTEEQQFETGIGNQKISVEIGFD